MLEYVSKKEPQKEVEGKVEMEMETSKMPSHHDKRSNNKHRCA